MSITDLNNLNTSSSSPMTILSFLAKAKREYPLLDSAEIERLLAHVLNKNTAYLRAFSERELTDEQVKTLVCFVKELARGKPLAYIVGSQAFWDMELRVNEHTLIPRADTEVLIESVKSCVEMHMQSNALKILDLGTGSGAIIIALSRLFPSAHFVATDKSSEALIVADENAKQWSPTCIDFRQADWLIGMNEKFDIIVSNPPYIAHDDVHLRALRYEPQTALTAGKDGLKDIRTIIAEAPCHLRDNGWLFIEHGYDQGDALRALFSESIWQKCTTIKDYGGKDRVTSAQIRAKK